MPSPRNLKELRSLPGWLQPLISKARTRCQSFSRQNANFVWTPKHKERGFFFLKLDLIFLMSAPVLSPPITGGPLLLFVFTTDDISVFWDVMAKDDDSWKIRPLTTSDLARKDYPPSAFGTEESQPLST